LIQYCSIHHILPLKIQIFFTPETKSHDKILVTDKSNCKTYKTKLRFSERDVTRLLNFYLPRESTLNITWQSRTPYGVGAVENVREIMAHTSHQGGAEGIHTVPMRKSASTPHGTLTSLRGYETKLPICEGSYTGRKLNSAVSSPTLHG